MNLWASVALLLCVALCDITADEAKTKAAMEQPRCGIIDYSNGGPSIIQEYKTFDVKKWRRDKELTFSITNHHKDLNKNEVNEDMRAALNIWTKYTNLKFREVNGKADIRISFESGDHGDALPFRPFDNVIAHASPPNIESGSIAHFNNDIKWTTGNNLDGINLYITAAHEFGHTLGLDHSTVTDSLMYEAYQNKTNFRHNLHSDDILAIQKLYGYKGDSQLCQIDKIDTIFWIPNGSLAVFKGNQYWRLPRRINPNYPQNISDYFPELSQKIDAAFNTLEKYTYYFKGDRVWKYWGTNLQQGFPKYILEEFPGIPNNIDTVFLWEMTRKLFFFKGNQVWLFDLNKSPHVPSNYPVDIDSWGIPTPFDGVLIFGGGIYIFKDMLFYKLNLKTKKVEFGFPKSTRKVWFHC